MDPSKWIFDSSESAFNSNHVAFNLQQLFIFVKCQVLFPFLPSGPLEVCVSELQMKVKSKVRNYVKKRVEEVRLRTYNYKSTSLLRTCLDA